MYPYVAQGSYGYFSHLSGSETKVSLYALPQQTRVSADTQGQESNPGDLQEGEIVHGCQEGDCTEDSQMWP